MKNISVCLILAILTYCFCGCLNETISNNSCVDSGTCNDNSACSSKESACQELGAKSQAKDTEKNIFIEIPLDMKFELVLDTFVNIDKISNKPTEKITMEFIKGDNNEITASGFAGVNNYNAKVSLDKETGFITFSAPVTTRMMGPAMEFESAFIQELSRVKNFRYAKRKLTLLDKDMKTIGIFRDSNQDFILDIYKEKKAASNADLKHKKTYKLKIGYKYVLNLESLQGVDEKVKSEVEKEVTWGFANDGVLQAVGCSGLNLYFSTVEEVNEETGEITLVNNGSSLMAGAGMEFEAAYLKALNSVKKYYYQDDKFYLLDDKENVILIFTKK